MNKKLQFKSLILLVALLLGGASSAWANDTYTKVTSSSQVKVGSQIIFVCEDNKQAMTSSSGYPGTGVTITNSTISLGASDGVCVLTVGGTTNAYTFTYDGNIQLSWAKNGFSTNQTDDSKNLWTIANDGSFTCNVANTVTDASTRKQVRHNVNNTNKFGCYNTSTGKVVCLYVKQVSLDKVSTPSIYGTESFLTSTNVTITCSTEGSTILYSTDGTTWDTYSAPLTLTETKTVTAKATKNGMTDSEEISKTFTKTNLMTVAQALTALEEGGTTVKQYVAGIISKIDTYGSNSITYWISDDGSTTKQLEVYKGKGLNGNDFNAITDLTVGDKVTVYGSLKNFVSGTTTTPEFDAGNYLISRTPHVPAVAAPTFTPAKGTYATAQNIEISCTTEGANIYYTTDGKEPTSSSTEYTGAITVSESKTIKAIAYKGTDKSPVATATYTIVSIEHAGTKADPYTVSDARNAIDANTGMTDAFVTGKVSKIVKAYTTENNHITINISSDGLETSPQLQAYHCINGSDEGAPNIENVKVGDVVVIKGNLAKYNSTYEFAENNVLISLESAVTQATPTSQWKNGSDVLTSIAINKADGTKNFTFETDSDAGTVTYTSSNTNVATIASNGTITPLAYGTTTITASTEETSAYFEDSKSFTLFVVDEGKDVLLASLIGKTSYSDWSDIQFSTEAVYAGNSTTYTENGSYAIQLRSKNNSGIVTTATGGRAKKITIVWNSNTPSLKTTSDQERRVDIYAKNTPYESPSDLYGDNNTSTKVGSLLYDGETSTDYLDIPGNYAYIGIRSNNGALYLDNIVVEWTNDVEVEFGESQMTTFSYGSTVDFTDSDIQAYTAMTDVTKGIVNLTPVDGNIVPSNTGVILIANGTNLTGSIIQSDLTDLGENEMIAANEDTAVVYNVEGKYNYILQNGKFYKATGKKLKSGKAFLSTTYNVAATGARELQIVFEGEEEATGIADIRSQKEEGGFFNLSGQRVTKPTKGLYINNGKKMIVK